MSEQGLTTMPSPYSVQETIDQLERVVQARGLRVFARIDHAAGAAEVGLALRPTTLVLFGHPRGGTALMQDRQTAGIDLPLKALAWEDEDGHVWLTGNQVGWLAQRHALTAASSTAVAALEEGQLAALRAVTTSVPQGEEGA